jgi:TRAP-type transport system periplasmic protein
MLSSALHCAACLFALLAVRSLHAQDANPERPEVRLSTAQAPSYPLGHAGERWAQLVNERAGGAYEIKHYPGATLALRDPEREFGALKEGSADLAVGSALAWSGQFAPLGVYSVPWLTSDSRELEALAADRALKDRIFALMEAAGVVGLAIAPLGERVLATVKEPVETPTALKGLRVRVMPLRPMLELYVALGSLPQAMSFTLAQAALASGALDAQDALPTTLVATRASASGQKFVTRWGAFADVMIFAVRKAAWDAWPEERRAAVRAAANQAAREANALPREDAALVQLTKEGVTIVRVSASQRAAFREAAKSAIAAWTAGAGEELVGVAQAAVAAAGK